MHTSVTSRISGEPQAGTDPATALDDAYADLFERLKEHIPKAQRFVLTLTVRTEHRRPSRGKPAARRRRR